MQKEIEVVDYIRNMVDATVEYYYSAEEKRTPIVVMHKHAFNFLKNFGIEISRNMIKAFNCEEQEHGEEYYKALFLLYSNMTNEDATAFIGALKGFVAREERKEVS